MKPNGLERRIKVGGILIIIGMFIALLSLIWRHPLSFLVPFVISVVLIVSGIVYYLVSLVKVEEADPEGE